MVTNQNDIKELVRERYGARAQRVIELSPVVEPGADEQSDGCGCNVSSACCGPEDMEHAMRLYNDGQLAGLPAESIAASAGCGNPTALAGLQPGERVLDLGSGGGIDCFLSAQQVGETGRVTGLDMTPSMLELARKNRDNLGFTNVEFVQGEIEAMPLPSDSYDVIISNCVVCLSPDKDAVFSESFRVLAPGGRSGTAVGMMWGVGIAVGALAAPLTGILIDVAGFIPAFLSMAGAALLGAIVARRLPRPTAR